MNWWLAFERKKTFQFWRELWIQVVVILLQLYNSRLMNYWLIKNCHNDWSIISTVRYERSVLLRRQQVCGMRGNIEATGFELLYVAVATEQWNQFRTEVGCFCFLCSTYVWDICTSLVQNLIKIGFKKPGMKSKTPLKKC